MKNLLIATTALVATAGMAAAEITFSGSARFGIVYDESSATAADVGAQDAAVVAINAAKQPSQPL